MRPADTIGSFVDLLAIFLDHVTFGDGLPLTKHWNPAVSLSFIVCDFGGVVMIGAQLSDQGLLWVQGGPRSPAA